MKEKSKISVSDNAKRPEQNEGFFSEHIIDNSRSMVSIINRNYVYEKVNKPFRSAHKGVIKSFVGKSMADVWGIETFQTKIKSRIDRSLAGKTVRYKASFTTPKYGKRHFEVVFRPIRSMKGEVTHLMAETFDVTDLKQSRNKVTVMKREFKAKEADFNNRLMQAQRLESIGVLAGGIAHDFNNILATISGYAEMLRDDLTGNPSYLEKTGKILSAVNRARSLTSQILTFSREVGETKEEVDVNNILKETLDFLRNVAPPSIDFKTNFSETRIPVFGDPVQLYRAFLNMLTNGIQAMQESWGTLFVSTSITGNNKSEHGMGMIQTNSAQYALITIRDTGMGMDESVLPRIFDPYFTTKEVGKGTGLGLSVVFGIIRAMEGNIVVSSKLHEGSVFDIYLPLYRK